MLCKVVAVLTFFIFHLGVAEDSTTSGLIVETLVMPDECTKVMLDSTRPSAIIREVKNLLSSFPVLRQRRREIS